MIPAASKIFRALILPCLALFLVCQISTATAATFCVSTAEELQTALTLAADNGEDDEIRIVQGSYYGNFIYSSDEPYGINIEGGFTATCSSKTIDPTKTILDAQGTGVVLALSAPDREVTFSVEGLTIKGGNSSFRGGGLFTTTLHGTVIVSNNIFSENTAAAYGGGVYIAEAKYATMTNNVMTKNSVPGYGGGSGLGIYGSHNQSVTLVGNNVSDNFGTGVWIRTPGSLNMVRNEILGNRCTAPECIAGGGAKLAVDNISFSNNTVSENDARVGPGGIYVYPNNSQIDSFSVIFSNNLITNNSGTDIGGVHIGVGGISASVILANNIISGNLSGSRRGGLSIYRNDDAAYREALITLTNNTIVGNSALHEAGGLMLRFERHDVTANVYNNIIWNNISEIGSDLFLENDADGDFMPGIINLYNNDFNQSSAGTYIQLPFVIHSSNLNAEDPLFIDPATGDYRLSEGSPCINTGSNDAPGLPATDKDGFPRIVGTSVDMGAYEYQGFVHPVAGFSAYPLSGVGPLTVFFTDESTGTIDAWEWNFGDGSTSSERNPTHTYNAPGIFSVSLTVIGDSTAWDTETKTDYITVISPDAPDLYGRCRDFHSRDFGAWIRIMLQIGNQGNQRANDFSVAFYLSPDGFTLGPLLDYSLVRGNLQPGSTRDIPMKYSSPTSLSGKYVIAVIDQENSIVELDETNNEIVIRVP